MSIEVPISERAQTARNARRRTWRKLHLYLGLFIGFLFAFGGLTGSALVFYQDIDEYLNPALLTATPGGDYAPLTEITAAAQSAAPVGAKPARLYFPRHPQAAMKTRFSVPRDGQDVLLDVMVNPFTAEVLGQRQWGGYLMSFLYKLHYTLLLGNTGETIVGVMGLLLICSTVSGIILWWPRLTKFFQAFTFRRSANGTRFIYDLHKTIGAYAAVVLMVIAFSGVYMIFPQYLKPIVGIALSFTELVPARISMNNQQEKTRIDIDAVARIASDFFPGAELQRIYFPTSVDGVYRVIMRQHGEIRKTSGSTQLWINPYVGNVIASQEPQTMLGGDTFLAWMFPLHNGEAFGLSGRIIVFLVGFIPIILYVTGLMVWWRKRKVRRDRPTTETG
jgi:uncharacterized iron-regulated membrane protein